MWQHEGAENEADEIIDGYDARTRPEVRGQSDRYVRAGLGALVGLKVSAIKQGLCILEFANIPPRMLELLRITRLTELFSS